MIKQKLITTLDRAHVLTSRGKCLGPIYPFLENVSQIGKIIAKGATVYEVLPDNTGVKLTEENFDKDNTATKPEVIFVDKIVVSESFKELEVGKTLQLTHTITPNNATDKAVTWSSSSNGIASVTDGLITAKKAGLATITVTTVNGKTATCEVSIKNPIVEVTTIALDNSSLELNIGDTVKLTHTITPNNATDKTVTWKSSDINIATIDNGTIVAIAEGLTDITVTTSNGKVATCNVIVTAPVVQP